MKAKDKAWQALQFATAAHEGQFRKYTGEPYIIHPITVAGLVATINNAPYVIATALLHDTIEDCGVTYDEIAHKFGIMVARGVRWLSDMEEGNRATRKQLSCERLAKSPKWVQNIKVCDLIANTSSIVIHDPDFAKVYIPEKIKILDALTKADERLIMMARKQIHQ